MYLSFKNRYHYSENMEKILQAKAQEKAGITMLVSDKVDFISNHKR